MGSPRQQQLHQRACVADKADGPCSNNQSGPCRSESPLAITGALINNLLFAANFLQINKSAAWLSTPGWAGAAAAAAAASLLQQLNAPLDGKVKNNFKYLGGKFHSFVNLWQRKRNQLLVNEPLLRLRAALRQ